MQEIVSDALERSSEEQQRMDEKDLEDFGEPQIVIVGAGGAGNNTVNRLHNIGVDGADTVAINTDKQHLQMIEADTKILIGSDLTEGLGAGGDPEVGRRAAEMGRDALEQTLEGADLVFVTAGMGGGTGTGAAPVVAETASNMGAIVVGMVSTPFDVERARLDRAEEGLHQLRESADSIIVLDNNRLLDYVPNLPVGKAFSVMDQIISETVKGIAETITQPSLINLDFADMKSIMSNGGVAVMLVGETSDDKNKRDVVEEAMNHPLLDVDYRGADGGLVHITGGPQLSLKEAEGISQDITRRLDDKANVIWGARVNQDFNGKVRVMAIMTGVESSQIMGPRNTNESSHSTSERNAPRQSSSNGIDRIS